MTTTVSVSEEVKYIIPIAMGHVLTLAPKNAEQAIRDKNGNGQGDLIRALGSTVFAQAELYDAKPKGVDAVHLSRLDGTDYCRWMGRRSDGCFHQIGRLMQIVPVVAQVVAMG